MHLRLDIPKAFESLYKGQLAEKKIIIYYGGRGSSKSTGLAGYAILKCLESTIRFLVVREIALTKAESVFAIVKKLIKALKLDDYITGINSEKISFVNGSEMLFMGISKDTINNIRSIDNVKYMWYDEAHNVSAEMFQVIAPSIRGGQADDTFFNYYNFERERERELLTPQIFFTLNPEKDDSFMWQTIQKHKADNPYIYVQAVNWRDNPFFNLEVDRLRDYETLPREVYNHIWEGEPTNYNDMQVIDSARIGFFDDSQKHQYANVIIAIDTATSTKTSADYSVIACYGKTKGGDTHLIHLARGQWDWHTLISQIRAVYDLIPRLAGASAKIILVEAKANGLNVMQEIRRTTNLNVQGVTPKTDKLSRVVNDFLPYIDKLKLPLDNTSPFNLWVRDFVKECKDFRADDKHAHDDMIDTACYALNYLYNNALDFNKISEALDL